MVSFCRMMRITLAQLQFGLYNLYNLIIKHNHFNEVIKIKRFLFTLVIIIVILYTNYDEIKNFFTKTDINTDMKIASHTEALKEVPIISNDKPLDERALLENALIEQGKLHKPGFITNDFKLNKTYIAYYPFNDTFGYSTTYQSLANHTTFSFDAGTSLDYMMYNSTKENITSSHTIQHKTIDLIYGKHTKYDDDYYILGKDKIENIVYLMHIGSETEGYTDEIVEKMGQSLKTEEEGAYDAFYNDFAIDVNQLKFPLFHDERVSVYEASIAIDKIKRNTTIQLTYMLSEQDFLIYQIEENSTIIDDSYKEVESFTTTSGKLITEYVKEDDAENRVFHWKDHAYDYTLSLSLKNTDIIDKSELREVIESVFEDNRSFENKDVFQPTHKKATVNQATIELNKLFEEMQDE